MSGPQQHVQTMLGMLQCIYDPRTPEQKRKVATAWVNALETQREAWQVCDIVLGMPKLPEQAYFVASNVLRAKILRQFDELKTQADRIGFRDSLMRHIQTFANGPHSVRRRLAICIASLSVQLCWRREWDEPVRSLLTQFGQNPGRIPVLLQILAEIPEEVANGRLRITKEQRRFVFEQLEKSTMLVVTSCANLLRNTNGDRSLQKSLVKVFSAWLKLGGVDTDMLAKEGLFVFDSIQVPELFEVSCHGIVNLIKLSANFNKPALAKQLMPRCLALRPHFHQAVENRQESVVHMLSNIFVELGNCYLLWIIQNSQDPIAHSIVEAILQCTAYSVSKRISTKTFGFWLGIATRVSQMEQPLRDQKRQVFANYYLRVLKCLKQVMTFPAHYDEWQDDCEEKDHCKNYRYLAADALTDYVSLPGLQQTMKFLWGLFSQEYKIFEADRKQWHGLEACLYCLRALGGAVGSNSETEVTSMLMQTLPKLTAHPALQYTATLIISRYTTWIDAHPQFLKIVFPYIVNGFNVPLVASSACMSFRYICEDCNRHMVPQFPNLLQLYQKFMFSNALPQEDKEAVITGMTAIVPVLPVSAIQGGLTEVFRPHVTQMNTVLKQQLISSDMDLILANALDSMTTSFLALTKLLWPENPETVAAIKQAGYQVMVNLTPVLQQAVFKYEKDPVMTEKIFRVVKYGMRAFQAALKPLVSGYVMLFLSQFRKLRSSSLLYMFGIVVEEFSRNNEHKQLKQLIFQVVGEFSKDIQTILHDSKQFVQHPGIVTEGFEMLNKVMYHCPDMLFMRGQDLQALFRCGLKGLHCQHKDSIRSLGHFYTGLLQLCVNTTRENQERGAKPSPEHITFVGQLLQADGQALMNWLIAAMAGSLRIDYCVYCISTLVQLFMSFKPLFLQFLAKAMTSVPEIEHPSKEQVFNIFQQLEPRTYNIRKLRDALEAFTAACRKAAM